jgi:endogenous inhibitor of DNA gyrase (YacG/DUF329 family)
MPPAARLRAKFRQVACPHCGKLASWNPVENPWRPFCSERCKLMDMGAWMTDAPLEAGQSAADRCAHALRLPTACVATTIFDRVRDMEADRFDEEP